MAETMTQVVANAPPTLDGKIYKLYSCDGKKDFPLMKESAGTQTSIQLNGRILTPDVENKENQNGEHVVQNQMTPTYAYPQASLEEYHHQVVSPVSAGSGIGVVVSSVSSEPSAPAIYTTPAAVTVTANGAVEQQTVRTRPFNVYLEQQTDLTTDGDVQTTQSQPAAAISPGSGPKRLHVSNIPFRFREADLRQLLGQFGGILDVEIIFNERGSKVNNATARVMTKKVAAPTIPNAAALRGVALTRGRAAAAVAARGAYTAAAAAAAAAALRHPTPLAAAPTAIPYAPSVYQEPFLATYTTDGAPRYQLVTTQPYATAAGFPAAAAAARYAIPAAMASAATYAPGYAGREYAAEPYIGHSIGPVTGYGATVYRGGYQRFAPY
ncbi:RNA binding protein fox-1 homolog 2-like isoform X6 [Pomacea canaliculata]|uniref:RNA binding protein fox-1 homolog 2-like isoform X6 n=1 Tax=Pomacea canaliculata TaxID=400727 RepID=UPI000D73CF15|nr:RNA binding protein fox-1 homolog 2-like isoform X6 [Pomacea canaliculata]